MKTLIIGTGVIGSIYGKALSEKHDVTHFVRPEKLEILNGKEITCDILDERKSGKQQYTAGTYTYRCTDRADGSYGLIIVPVKTQQLIPVLKQLAQQAPNTKLLLFTLDWQNEAAINQILRKDRYILGYPGGGGTLRNGVLWANLGKDIMLGAAYPEQKELLEWAAGQFRLCGIEPEIADNPYHWLWMHNISTAPFGAAIRDNMDVGQMIEDKKTVQMAFRAMRECFAICRKKGVDLDRFGEFKIYNLPVGLVYFLFRLNYRLNPAMRHFTAHASEALDEMRHNFLEIYDSGLEYGVDMPNMRALWEMIN